MKENDESKEQKKRILIVIGTLAIGGGAEKVAATVGSELSRRGHTVHLLTFYEAEQKYPFSGTYRSFNESPASRLNKLFLIPAHIWRIAKYVRDNDINVTASFLEEANFQLLISKILFFRTVPVIVSVRNNIEKREWLFKAATRVLYPFAAKVVSVTRAVEEILKSRFHLKNTTTIYNPLDLDLIAKKAAEPLPDKYAALFSQHPLCISIGRLIHQKGQWHLIRAFAKVKTAQPSAALVILGEGEYRPKLEQLIKDCGLTDSVHLIGKHENVYQFLARADLFVFSSLYEGMPNTMLEALSVGLPIVSPDCVSGPREIIAPELSVISHLNYPYETKIGTLTEALSNDFIENSLLASPLTPAEAQLSAAMIKYLSPDKNAPNSLVTEKFSLPSITDDWEHLVYTAR